MYIEIVASQNSVVFLDTVQRLNLSIPSTGVIHIQLISVSLVFCISIPEDHHGNMSGTSSTGPLNFDIHVLCGKTLTLIVSLLGGASKQLSY